MQFLKLAELENNQTSPLCPCKYSFIYIPATGCSLEHIVLYAMTTGLTSDVLLKNCKEDLKEKTIHWHHKQQNGLQWFMFT